MGAEDVEQRPNTTQLLSSSSSSSPMNLIFTYGTLKRGFSNHVLLEDMISSGDALYMGVYKTVEKLPLVCGPYRVPFLLNLPGLGDNHVFGELYAVSATGLAKMDELEGLTKSHYERLPLKVNRISPDSGDYDLVEAYYAHRSYAESLWKRNDERGFSCYTEKEARGYIKRKDRPTHLTFLEQIRLFVSSSSP